MKRIVLNNKNKEEIIKEAVDTLNKGGLIIYPTETCYGVGGNALEANAVNKVLLYKHRPEGKAVSVAVLNKDMATRYVILNDTAESIYDNFLPGPVTVISASKGVVDKRLEAEDGTLGVRIPRYQLILDIISKLDAPITSTSANSSGKKTPYTVEDVIQNITKKQLELIDLIIDAGELTHNPPSTVIDTTKEDLKVIRKGNFSLGKIIIDKVIENEEDMRKLGEDLINRYIGSLKYKSLLVLFNAELGAGKTQFTKGIAEGLGIIEVVNSPTFVILKEYRVPDTTNSLIHIDAWRLESIDELKRMDIDKYLIKGNVVVVEWAGMARDYLSSIDKKDNLRLYIEIGYESLSKRRVKIYEE